MWFKYIYNLHVIYECAKYLNRISIFCGGITMKKIIAFALCLVLFFSFSALASTANDDEKTFQALLGTLDEETINKLLFEKIASYSDDALIALQDAIAEEINGRDSLVPFTPMQKGSRGEDVIAAQKRLIELNYLSGSADGAFGGMTEEAVKLFQKEADIPQTGVIDKNTFSKLMASDAPKAKVYTSMDYDAVSRDPALYEGNMYKITGKVLQVLEGSSWGGTTTVNLRVSTKGYSDNVVYVVYERPDNESRILEDDRVTICGIYTGLYSYTAVMGNTITIPKIDADTITRNW